PDHDDIFVEVGFVSYISSQRKAGGKFFTPIAEKHNRIKNSIFVIMKRRKEGKCEHIEIPLKGRLPSFFKTGKQYCHMENSQTSAYQINMYQYIHSQFYNVYVQLVLYRLFDGLGNRSVLKMIRLTPKRANCDKVNFESLKYLVDDYCLSGEEEKKEIKVESGTVRIKKQWVVE
ncbi:hypothetical protein E2320_017632, partial [Naja naja]